MFSVPNHLTNSVDKKKMLEKNIQNTCLSFFCNKYPTNKVFTNIYIYKIKKINTEN